MQIFVAIGNFFLDIIETVVIALSIFLIIYLFAVQPHQVSGHSMDPTFADGQYLLTDKITYKRSNPHRGDVVVFKAPEDAACPEGTGCDYIKRVIAVPGDTVEVRDCRYYINGSLLPESYIASSVCTGAGAATSGTVLTIPTGYYFVSGDNRPNSSDSRAWGPVPKSNIIGKVFFRYWPPTEAGVIKSASY